MVRFITEISGFKVAETRKTKKWLGDLINNEGFKLLDLNYIFVSDEELLEMNQSYLDHDTYTDIITFDNSDLETEIEGDIFISVDRIKENANTYGVAFENELRRVLAHGALHLCGYPDKKPEEAVIMRQMEDKYLDLY